VFVGECAFEAKAVKSVVKNFKGDDVCQMMTSRETIEILQQELATCSQNDIRRQTRNSRKTIIFRNRPDLRR